MPRFGGGKAFHAGIPPLPAENRWSAKRGGFSFASELSRARLAKAHDVGLTVPVHVR